MAIIQKYNLNMLPGRTPVVVPVSQYDKSSRIIEFDLYEGARPYTIPSGSFVIINGAKTDGTAYTYECSYAAGAHGGSTVSVVIEQQMTVTPGHQPAEIVINGLNINPVVLGSANFEFYVEASPIDGAVISETDLPVLEEAIQAAVRAEAAAQQVEQTVEAVESIVPQSAGTAGQILTNTGNGADWQDSVVKNTGVYESTAKAIPNSTWTELLTITTPDSGIYLVNYGAMFATNATGRRSIRLAFDDNPSSYTMHTVRATEAETAMLGLSWVIKPGSPMKVTLLAWQNSGGNLNVNQRCIYLTKLK